MEKQRIKRIIKSGRRFLVSFLIILTSATLSAQTLSLEETNSLRIIPEEGQKLYTKTDIKFTVTLPKVPASQVQIISADQQSDISFRTIRKSENYGENGTTIDIWYNFSKKGSYKLAPLSVMIQNRRRNIAFEEVTLTDDPATMLPRMALVFEDGTIIYSDETAAPAPILKIKRGRKLHFSVKLQYANQLVSFNWDLPKNSIFTCTREYNFTEARQGQRIYTHDLAPVADFEWTGLISGMQELPVFHLNASSYSGYKNDLSFPQLYVEFIETEDTENSQEEDDIFSAAFSQEEKMSDIENAIILSKEDCQSLADLYTREHNEFLMYRKARQARIDFEKEHSLLISDNPIFPGFFLYFALIIALLSLIFLILSSRKKHKIRSLIYSTFLIASLALLIYCSVRRNEHYGISNGCKLYSIPENNAASVSELGSGIMVRIIEKTDKWYYVEVGETGGWCATDDICIIK